MADDPGISDGDLVRLARDGDPVAFRLLVERHQPMVRARAAGLCANASDVDDIMQEAFLRAFIALDRLREPDRFAGWLAGIVLNVCRGLRRRDPVTLLPDSPEPPPASAFPAQPASANGQPSADDLDRADALREAMATLPAGQRRAVFLHYYAGLPAGQIGDQAGAARVSLHKARRRLREYLTEHRPDLVPRRLMTTVRIASVEHQRRRTTRRKAPAISSCSSTTRAAGSCRSGCCVATATAWSGWCTPNAAKPPHRWPGPRTTSPAGCCARSAPP